jgi:hypothetical protein
MEAAVEIYITFKLRGWHAQHFMQVLRIVNLAPGRLIDESELAASIVRAVIEDDARDNDQPPQAMAQ